MEDTDLEEILRENGPRIWPQYRHASDQRIQTFLFSMGFLGVFSGALTWLLIQDTGPWIFTPLALLMTVLSIALVGMERQFAARLRYLQPLLRSEEIESTGRTPSKKGGATEARGASGGEPAFKRDAWPIFGAYAAFATLGLFYAALPIWARPHLAKAPAQAFRSEEDSSGRPMPDRRFPATPFAQSGIPSNGAPPSFGNPRQFAGATPIQISPFIRPPVRTPMVRQGPFGSPAGATATPPAGPFPPSSISAKPLPGSLPITPPPNGVAPK